MFRLLSWLCLLTLSLATFGAAQDSRVDCYLIDSRIHLAVVFGPSGAEGELCWHDTVTGQSGEAPFVATGSALRVEGPSGACSEAHILPNLAIVLRNPPWAPRDAGLALGVALN